MLKRYQCPYCGLFRTVSAGRIPLKTKCPKRQNAGLHVWVKVSG